MANSGVGPRARRAAKAVVAGSQTAGRAGAAAASGATRVLHKMTHASGAGRTGLAQLIELSAAGSVGDGFVAVALAGTLFFSTSVHQARGRVALALLITMAPFALLAPFIGPMLDRVQQGRKYILIGTVLARGLLCWGMAGAVQHNDSLTLLPAAFGVLLLQKAYGVTRASVTPRLLPEEITLVTANSRCALASLIATSAGVPLAAGIDAICGGGQGGAAWVLRVGTLVYLAAMVPGIRLPSGVDEPLAEPEGEQPGEQQRPGQPGARETRGQEPRGRQPKATVPYEVPPFQAGPGYGGPGYGGPDYSGPGFNGKAAAGAGPAGEWPEETSTLGAGAGAAAAGLAGGGSGRTAATGARPGASARAGRKRRQWRLFPRPVGPVVGEAIRANLTLRAYSGFMIFFLAFLLRTVHFGAVPDRVALGAMIAGVAVGGFTGTLIGAALRSRAPQVMTYVMLAFTLAVTAVCAANFGLWAAVIVAFAAAVGQTLVKLALDSIVQREISSDVRSSTFAVSETLHQLSWVAGALLGLLLSMTNSGVIGLSVAASCLALSIGSLLLTRRGRILRARAAPLPGAMSPDPQRTPG